ncbi:MAG: DUF2480 family protein [Rhodothermales bacterium]
MEPIRNRVEESDLMVLDLEKLWGNREIVPFDIAPFLDRGLVLREKSFREALEEHDWAQYRSRLVAVHLTTRAIVPKWAYMLVASKLHGHASAVHFGTPDDLVRSEFTSLLDAHDWSAYLDRNVVVKGCPSDIVPTSAYVQAMASLQNVANKIMYGEACSAVPVWRRPAASRGSAKAVAAKLPSRSS